jgi:hypothetical protein
MWFRTETTDGSSEYDNEILGSMQGGEFPGCLSGYFFKKDPSPWIIYYYYY